MAYARVEPLPDPNACQANIVARLTYAFTGVEASLSEAMLTTEATAKHEKEAERAVRESRRLSPERTAGILGAGLAGRIDECDSVPDSKAKSRSSTTKRRAL